MPDQEPRALLDWLAWTEMDRAPSEIAHDLGGEWTDSPIGGLGYRRSLRRGPASILYDGSPGMGAHVRLPGSAVRDQETHDAWNWPDHLARVADHLTRLDVTMDDRTGNLTVARALEALMDNRIVMRWHKSEVLTSRNERTGESATTIYLGNRQSESFARIYDKAAQMHEPGPWTRLELEFKDEKAAAAAKLIARVDVPTIGGIIRDHIDIRAPGRDTNLRRRPQEAWWADFLEGAERLHLSLDPRAATTSETALAALDSQWTPWLAVLRDDPLTRSRLSVATARATTRWKAPHHVAAAAARATRSL